MIGLGIFGNVKGQEVLDIYRIVNKDTIKIGVGSFTGFNEHGEIIEKTEDGFDKRNEKGQLIERLAKLDKRLCFLKFKYEKNGDIKQEMYIDQNNDGKIDLKEEYYTYSIQLAEKQK